MEPDTSTRRGAWSTWVAMTAGAVAASIVAVLALGKSVGVDAYNYEFAGGFSLLHGFGSRFELAGQFQTYFDAQVNVFYYLVIRHLPAVAAEIVIASAEALTVGMLGFLTTRGAMLWGLGRRASHLLGAVAAALAVLSPIYLTELGSTSCDTLVALPYLVAFALVAVEVQRDEPSLRRCLLAGLLLGVAALLKLYLLGYAAALVVGFAVALLRTRPHGRRVRALVGPVTTGVTALVVWFLLYLPMAVLEWHRYHDPVFPFYNKLFRSPDLLAGDFQDPQYRLTSLHQAVRHLADLVLGGKGVYAVSFRAPLLVLGVLLVLALLAVDLWRGRDGLALLVETTVVLGFVGWWYLDFYRYAALWEMALPAVIFVLLLRHGLLVDRRVGPVAVAGVVALCLVGLLSNPSGVWESERSSYHGSFLGQDAAQLSGVPSHLLLTTGDPTGSLVAFLPRGTTVVRLGGNLAEVMSPRWWAAAHDDVLSHGSTWEVVFDQDDQAESQDDLRLAGLAGTYTDCTPFPVRLLLRAQDRLQMCAVTLHTVPASGP